ncbi:type VII secretion protein EccB [Mycobacterium tuberculosis]
MPSQRRHNCVGVYRFLLRHQCALLFGDVCAARRSTARAQHRWPSVRAGDRRRDGMRIRCAAAPQSALGRDRDGSESGALYVRVDDVWHPVLNLASARLIAATNANPQPVSGPGGPTKRPLLGIPVRRSCPAAGRRRIGVGDLR